MRYNYAAANKQQEKNCAIVPKTVTLHGVVMTSIQRKYPSKKWGQVYADRVDHLLRQRDKKLQIFANERRTSSNSILQNSAPDSHDQLPSLSLTTFMRTCKHTVENTVPPPKQLNWNAHWGTQLLCYLCSTPAYSDCIVCSKCNLIAHNLCAEAIHLKSNVQRSKLFTTKSRVHPVPIDHICPECKDAFQKDIDFYQKVVENLKEEKLRNHCATVITKRAKIFIERKKALKKKLAVVFIQSLFRGKLVRAKFLAGLRSKPRIVILKLQQLPKFLAGVQCAVVITVQDTFKDVQLFRYDKTLEQALSESILIPGLTWYMTVVVTVAVKEEGQSFHIIGQSQLCVRDLDNMMKQKVITLTFFEKISWIPQEVHGCKHFHLIANHSKMFYILGQEDFVAKLSYLPQNPITTLCMMLFAPPLDILKRSADLTVKKKKSDVSSGGSALMYRNSRYWVCLHGLKIWFYQYYTDASPRFGSDVAEATAVILCDKGRPTSLINLVHADQRSWLLEFSTKQDASKFELALNESKKALSDQSIYSNGSEFEEQHFGFNIPVN